MEKHNHHISRRSVAEKTLFIRSSIYCHVFVFCRLRHLIIIYLYSILVYMFNFIAYFYFFHQTPGVHAVFFWLNPVQISTETFGSLKRKTVKLHLTDGKKKKKKKRNLLAKKWESLIILGEIPFDHERFQVLEEAEDVDAVAVRPAAAAPAAEP